MNVSSGFSYYLWFPKLTKLWLYRGKMNEERSSRVFYFMLVLYEMTKVFCSQPLLANAERKQKKIKTRRHEKYEAKNESLLHLLIVADKFFICLFGQQFHKTNTLTHISQYGRFIWWRMMWFYSWSIPHTSWMVFDELLIRIHFFFHSSYFPSFVLITRKKNPLKFPS